MEARPLPPRPSLEQYKKQAKDLLKACISPDPNALHQWVSQWVESYAGQEAEVQAQPRGRAEIAGIEKKIQESKLVKPKPRLADAQFFVARVHGFDSWSKFASSG